MMSQNSADYSPYQENDVQGFQSKLYNSEQIFGELQGFDLPNQIFQNEQIKQLVVGSNQIAVLTRSNKIFRMTQNRGFFQRIEFIDRIEQQQSQQQQQQQQLQQQQQQNQGNIIGSFLSNVVSGVGSVVSGVGSVVTGVGSVVGGLGQMLFLLDSSSTVSIDRIFLDPFGHHLIASTDQGVNFYLNYNHQDTQMRLLRNVRGEEYVITSIGWDQTHAESKQDAHSYKTKSIILGTSKGFLYIYSIKMQVSGEIEETVPFLVLELHNASNLRSVIGLKYLKIYSNNRKEKKFLVIASTAQSIYAFSGSDVNLHLQNFKQFQQQSRVCTSIKDLEINSDYTNVQNSLFSLCAVIEDEDQKNIPHSIFWANEFGLFYQAIPRCYEEYKEGFIKDLQKFKYMKGSDQNNNNNRMESTAVQEMPIDILLTEFHYILLHYDYLTILSRINEKVVTSYDLRSMGQILGMQYDAFNKIIWIYSLTSIQLLSIQNEEKDGWKLYLEKKQFNLSYETAKKANIDKQSLEYLAGLYGDQQFKDKEYVRAAQLYFETSRNFEEVTMKFLNQQLREGDLYARDGLEEYLTLWLKNLKGEIRTQKYIILYWLIEIKAQKINNQEVKSQYYKQYDLNKFNNSVSDRERVLEAVDNKLLQLKESLTKLLETYIHDLEENTVYQILQTHGRLKDGFDFARKKNSFEVIVKNDLNENKYQQVLIDISYIPREREKQRTDLLIQYSHILMQKEAEILIEKLKKFQIKPYRQQNKTKSERENKLVRALLDIPKKQSRLAIDFLKYLINECGCDDKTIHNMLIYFLSEQDTDFELSEYFEQQEEIKKNEERVHFSIEFAFSIAKAKQLYSIQVKLFGLLGMYSEAIQMDLEKDYGFYYSEYIKQPKNIMEQKRLLQQVAKHYLKNENIQEVIGLFETNPLLQVEEVLPYFQEGIDVSLVTKQICKGLKDKNGKIEELTNQIKSYSISADKIKQDLKSVNKYILVNQEKTCRECNKHLFTDTFYIFPCKHGFHKNCLILKVVENGVDQIKLERINNLNKKIEELDKSLEALNARQRESIDDEGIFNNPLNKLVNFVAMAAIEEDHEEKQIQQAQFSKEVHNYRLQLDQELATECIECGPNIIESIYKKPFNDNIKIANTWRI